MIKNSILALFFLWLIPGTAVAGVDLTSRAPLIWIEGSQDSIAWVESICLGRDSIATLDCRDSLIFVRKDDAEKVAAQAAAAAALRKEQNAIYFADFMADIFPDDRNTIGNTKDLALVVFVAAGVIVIGATVIYLPKLAYDLAKNEDDLPIYHEFTLHYGYSGAHWNAGGPPVYRKTQTASGRFTLGARRDYLGVGLTAEVGYLDIRLSEVPNEPGRTFYRNGPFGMMGPSIELGGEKVYTGVDFLNGVDFIGGAGWISEGRFSLNWRVNDRLLLGAYVGALFYDLKFFDGLVWREGAFNRDLSLLGGLETGVAF